MRVLFLLCAAAPLLSQVLTTIPGGKGKTTIFGSTSALGVQSYTVIPYNSLYYIYGTSDRTDVYGGINATTALGYTQWSGSVGANIGLDWAKNQTVNLSLLTLVTIPLSRRNDSCGLQWYNAIVASKRVKLLGRGLTFYTGYAVNIPFGKDLADKLFSSDIREHSVPVGTMWERKNMNIFVEYGLGKNIKAGSLGFGYTF